MRLNKKICFPVILFLSTALSLTVVWLLTNQGSLVSTKKVLEFSWGEDSSTLFYLAEETPTETSFRKLKVFPSKKEEKIALDFQPQDAVWISDNTVLLASPKLDYQKGHYVELDLKSLSQQPVHLPLHYGLFSFSPEGERILVFSTTEEKPKLFIYKIETKTFEDAFFLPEEITNAFKVQWSEEENVLVSIGRSEYSTEEKHYLLNLKSGEVSRVSEFEDYLFNPKLYQNKILFSSHDGLVLYDMNKKSKEKIVEAQDNTHILSYSFVDNTNFVYLETGSNESSLYLFNLKENKKYSLADFEERMSYLLSLEPLVSPDKKKVAFRTPEGYLQVVKIRPLYLLKVQSILKKLR